MLVYYLHPLLPYGLGVGHLHLVMLLMHSSDRPPSPPMHIDLTLFPQLLASSKLFTCCVQYLQRLLNLPTLSLPLLPLVFFPSPLVGGAPPTIVPPTATPTTGCSNVPGGCYRRPSLGTVDRSFHFGFENRPIIEVRGAFWVMGHSLTFSFDSVNTLEQSPLPAITQTLPNKLLLT
jgi:hypothetical protein